MKFFSLLGAAIVTCACGESIAQTAIDTPEHVVDAVLLPNIPTMNIFETVQSVPTMNIVETAQSVPDLSMLVELLAATDLAGTLSAAGSFTVFAPTNAALAAFGMFAGEEDGLCIAQYKNVLLYHVLSQQLKSMDFTNGDVLSPLFAGHALGVDLTNGVKIIGERSAVYGIPPTYQSAVMVTTADIACTNGVIHIVDAVLIPISYDATCPYFPTIDILDTIQSVPDLSMLVEVLVATDLAGTLSAEGPFTVFAPTNAALAAFNMFAGHEDGLSKAQYKNVLLYHVLSQQLKSMDFTNGDVLSPLFAGHALGVDLTNGVKIIGERSAVYGIPPTYQSAVMVTFADMVCSNGVVHIVDAVLIPISYAVAEVV